MTLEFDDLVSPRHTTRFSILLIRNLPCSSQQRMTGTIRFQRSQFRSSSRQSIHRPATPGFRIFPPTPTLHHGSQSTSRLPRLSSWKCGTKRMMGGRGWTPYQAHLISLNWRGSTRIASFLTTRSSSLSQPTRKTFSICLTPSWTESKVPGAPRRPARRCMALWSVASGRHK